MDNATAATESNPSLQGQVTGADSNMGNYTVTINSSSQEESGNETNVPPRLEGAVSGLALLKRKMEEIDLERKKIQTEQAKLSETVDTMLSSLNGLSDEMITMRKDITEHNVQGRAFRLHTDSTCSIRYENSITKEKEGHAGLVQGGVVIGR
jgi:hypothetical protein